MYYKSIIYMNIIIYIYIYIYLKSNQKQKVGGELNLSIRSLCEKICAVFQTAKFTVFL